MKTETEKLKLCWLNLLKNEPIAAVDDVLFEKIILGEHEDEEASDTLLWLIMGVRSNELAVLDVAMLNWLAKQQNTTTDTSEPVRKNLSKALDQFFESAQRAKLSKCLFFTIEHCKNLRDWLRKYYIDIGRDPEGSMLNFLALNQPHRRFIPMWLDICRLNGVLPTHYGRIALLGLRSLPYNGPGSGAPPQSLVVDGLIQWGESLHRHSGDDERLSWIVQCRLMLEDLEQEAHEEGKQDWLRIFDRHTTDPNVKRWLCEALAENYSDIGLDVKTAIQEVKGISKKVDQALQTKASVESETTWFLKPKPKQKKMRVITPTIRRKIQPFADLFPR